MTAEAVISRPILFGRGPELDFGLKASPPRAPWVMGIVNVTPDSLSDGGLHASVEDAGSHAMQLVADGADVLDIGGESTRPGAEPVSESQELDRVIPVIEAIRRRWDGPISIDTMKPSVARAAIGAGAAMWNDVTALTFSADSVAVAAELQCEVVLMHMRGEPRTMQAQTDYEYGVTAEVSDWLVGRAWDVMLEGGIHRDRIWLDPGFGFGKTAGQNLELTRNLGQITRLGFPVVYAASRKRTIAMIDPTATDPDDRIGGSLALALEGAARGAAMIRVHDVRETVQALKVQAAVDAAAAP